MNNGKRTDEERNSRGGEPSRINAPAPAGRHGGETHGHPVAKRRKIAKTPIRQATGDRTPVAQSAPGNVGPTISARDAQRWERVRAQLRAQLGEDSFASWFGRCRLEMISTGQLTLSVPTTFLKSWLRTHYQAILLKLWQEQIADLLRVDVVIRSAVRSQNSENGEARRQVPQAQNSLPAAGAGGTSAICGERAGENGYSVNIPGRNGLPVQPAAASQRIPMENGLNFVGSPLDRNYSFATFVEGSSNRMACAAARSVAETDGGAARFNPLFIHANVGLGKTHLLQAIAWAATERNSGSKILYLTAEYFMWRFASAIRDKAALSFKESLRDIDLLLIDDMQFLQGKSIQQEFCHLLNALIDSAKQVVVAADRPPSELESLDDRVKSRLRGGVALEVKAPDLDMRKAMLDLRYREAQRDDPNLDIPESVLHFVAGKVDSSGRDLEGAFNQLLIQHRFSEGPLDLQAIDRILGHLVQSGEQRRVRIEDIQKVVARHYNVTRHDLLSDRRTRVIVRPRQIAMYLAKNMTPRSLPEIGRRFGGRDHTTVLHAVRKVDGMLKDDAKLEQELELLKRLIHEFGQ